MKKYALLIGVGEYNSKVSAGSTGANPSTAPWCDLSSDNDVFVLRSTLLTLYGFKAANIRVLTGSANTTKNAILASIDSLTREVSKDDAVYIHFSGHGDTFESGQTLVPSDWFRNGDPKDSRGEGHITAAELGAKLSTLKRKLLGYSADQEIYGGNSTRLFITFDCCHSGHLATNVRGKSTFRIRGKVVDTVDVSQTVSRGRATAILGTPVLSELMTGRGFISLAACRFSEKAGDGEIDDLAVRRLLLSRSKKSPMTMGYFTYCFVKAISTHNGPIPVSELAADIQSRMKSLVVDQNPVVEGDDRVSFFDGTERVRSTYYLVSQSRSTGMLEISGGLVDGLFQGQQLHLYKNKAVINKSAGRIGSAIVRRLNLNTATIEVKPPVKLDLMSNCVAVPIKQLNDKPLRLLLHSGTGTDVGSTLSPYDRQFWAGAVRDSRLSGLVSIVDSNHVQIVVVKVDGGYDLHANAVSAKSKICQIDTRGQSISGPSIRTMASTTQMVDDLIVLLERVVRLNRIAQLASLHTNYTNEPSKKPDVSVEFRMVRVTEHSGEFQIHGGAENSQSNEIVTNDSFQPKTWKIGDWFAIEVRNRGTRDTYMSILDVQPNGYVSSVYPPTKRVSEVFHPTGKWMTLGLFGKALVFQVGEPCGVETMYCIATDATSGYVDFSRLSDASVFSERNTSRGKNKSLRATATGVNGSNDISRFLFGTDNTRGPRASTVDSPSVDVRLLTYDVTNSVPIQ